jgi:PTS system galactitol-specific IIA component
MEDCDTEIDVEIVMLLAISESDKQLKMLQTIMKMLSKEEFILLLKEKESEEEIAQLLNRLGNRK